MTTIQAPSDEQIESDTREQAIRLLTGYLLILATLAGIPWTDEDDANMRLIIR